MKRKLPYTEKESAKQKKRKIVKPTPSAKRYGYSTIPRSPGVFGKGEMKYFDCNIAATAMGAWAMLDPVGGVLNLCSPGPGANIDQRIGREIYVMKLKVRGYVNLNSAIGYVSAPQANQVRIILFQDSQTNGTQATAASIMDTAGANGPHLAFQNLANFGRFRVLKDKLINLNFNAMTTNAANSIWDVAGELKTFKFNVNFPQGVRVRFNATNTAVIGDIIDNSFHIAGAAAHGAPGVVDIAYRARACYRDPQ